MGKVIETPADRDSLRVIRRDPVGVLHGSTPGENPQSRFTRLKYGAINAFIS